MKKLNSIEHHIDVNYYYNKRQEYYNSFEYKFIKDFMNKTDDIVRDIVMFGYAMIDLGKKSKND